MRVTQKLNKRISDEGFRKTMPIRQIQQRAPLTQLSLIGSLRQLISNLRTQSKQFIQEEVSLKTHKLYAETNINLSACSSLIQLRYLILGLLETQKENSHQDQFKSTSPLPLRQNLNSATYRGKKTNIYIDLDFTQFLDQIHEETLEKQRTIQKLQQMMIDKENEIDILEDENNQLKRQVEEIGLENIDYQASLQNQKQGIQDKVNSMLEENQKLKNAIDDMSKQLASYQSEVESNPDQFLRRCLLAQAVSIQHFLVSEI